MILNWCLLLGRTAVNLPQDPSFCFSYVSIAYYPPLMVHLFGMMHLDAGQGM